MAAAERSAEGAVNREPGSQRSREGPGWRPRKFRGLKARDIYGVTNCLKNIARLQRAGNTTVTSRAFACSLRPWLTMDRAFSAFLTTARRYQGTTAQPILGPRPVDQGTSRKSRRGRRMLGHSSVTSYFGRGPKPPRPTLEPTPALRSSRPPRTEWDRSRRAMFGPACCLCGPGAPLASPSPRPRRSR